MRLTSSILAFVLGAMASPPVSAQQSMGMLTEFLPELGQDGSWWFSAPDGDFGMATYNPRTVKLFEFARTRDNGEAIGPWRATVSVDVESDDEVFGAGGMVFAIPESGIGYFAAVIDTGGNFRLLQYLEEGYVSVLTSTPERPFAQPFRFEVRSDAEGFWISAPDVEEISFGVQSEEIGLATQSPTTGGFGIIAFGAVEAVFSDFKFEGR